MQVTRFGLQIPSFTFPGVEDGELFERIARIAITAEESGFDSVWMMDHFYQIHMVGPRSDPMFEAYTTLGAIAARTFVSPPRSVNSTFLWRWSSFFAMTALATAMMGARER